MRPSKMSLAARHAVLLAFAAAFLIPFIGVVVSSLQVGPADPGSWTIGNFAKAWDQGRFTQLMASSLLIELIVVPTTLVLSVLAGYGLAVLRPRGGAVITTGFVIGLTLPIELVVIALYYNLDAISLTNNYIGLGLAEIALYLPFGVYWMETHFRSLPRELVESGRVDGARDFRVLTHILLPISGPAVTTLVVLLFVWVWNQFLMVLVIMQTPAKRTATAGLGYFVGEFSTDVPLLSAASLLVIIPVVVVYLFFQRSFVEGVTQGSIKG